MDARQSVVVTQKVSGWGPWRKSMLLTFVAALLLVVEFGTSTFGLFAASKLDQARTEITQMKQAVALYARKNHGFPDELSDVTQLGDHLIDPWGRPYRYRKEVDNEDGFLIFSEGKTERDDFDDIRSDELVR